MKRVKIVFLGPPGSGKGTQAKRLAEQVKLPHVNVGEMFRKAIQTGTEVGKKVKGYMDQGSLVPDSLVIEVVEEALSALPGGWILDGYPRTMAQAKALDIFLKTRNDSLTTALYINASVENILDRLTLRRECRGCGLVYHLKYLKPKKDSLCDQCGKELTARADDQPEVIQRRFDVYQAETAPVLDYYQAQSLLNEIDGDVTPNDVAGQIRQTIGVA